MFRPVGSVLIASASMTRWRVVLWTSTIGASPVTVIVSLRLPTVSVASTVEVNDPVRLMPSRLTPVKPVSEKVTT
jgi:hypothetical protein